MRRAAPIWRQVQSNGHGSQRDAGPSGQALASPPYGIDFVDQGLPAALRAGVEALAGGPIPNVRVHYNSPHPARVGALAYTQGAEIHLAPGQERHLAHEAWHVVQQQRGRVSPTARVNGFDVNADSALEHEADVMGERALERGTPAERHEAGGRAAPPSSPDGAGVIQRIAASELVEYGLQWWAKVWGGSTSELRKVAREEILTNLNKLISKTGFRAGRGFQDSDPVVRPARKYLAIVPTLDADGANNAVKLFNFMVGKAKLEDLPKALQEFALIVCFAEVGRGYSSSIKSELVPWLADIAAGKSKWADVKERWAPSLTYAEDLKEDALDE